MICVAAHPLEGDDYAEHLQPYEQDRVHGGLRCVEAAVKSLLPYRHLRTHSGETLYINFGCFVLYGVRDSRVRDQFHFDGFSGAKHGLAAYHATGPLK